MSEKIDFKKRDKAYYMPPTKPVVVEIPEMHFLMVDGKGDPNGPLFKQAVQALYSLSYAIKMAPKAGKNIEGYYEYAVAPLEGLWDGGSARNDWTWTAMIRQPEFVTDELFAWALERAAKKKPDVDFSGVRFEEWAEGKCIQILHIGPFATENESFAKVEDYRTANGLELLGKIHHHEIYLSDFTKVAPEKLKTVLRQQLR